MCGLVGMAGNFFGKHEKMLRFMLLFDTLRGPHSTGVSAVDQSRNIETLRKTIPGWEFVEEPQLNSLLRMTDRVWIGHNRFATVGKITRNNAHPFEVYDKEGEPVLVGAHNGTISNRGQGIDNAYKFNTDSEGLFNMIHHKGLAETLAGLEGAWALTFYDKKSDTINFIRNKERPLFFCYVGQDEKAVGKKDVIAWASERWMLEVASERADLYTSDIWYIDEDTLYSFRLPNKNGDKITFGVKEGLVGKPPVPPTQRVYNGYSAGSSGGTTHKPPRYSADTGWKAEVRQRWNSTTEKWEEIPIISAGTETQEEIELRRSREGGNVTQLPMMRQHSTDENSSKSGSQSQTKNTQENPVLSKEAGTETNSTTTSPTSFSRGFSNVRYKAFEGARLTEEEFSKIIDRGCCWCGDAIPLSRNSPMPRDPVAWIAADLVACNSCVYDTHDIKGADPHAAEEKIAEEMIKAEEVKDKAKDNKRRKLTVVKAVDKKPVKVKTVKKGGLTQQEIDNAVNGRALQEAARKVN